MDMIISSKSTMDFSRDVIWILRVCFVQHCFIRLLLSLYHCMRVTDCFIEISTWFYLSPVNSCKDATLQSSLGIRHSLCMIYPPQLLQILPSTFPSIVILWTSKSGPHHWKRKYYFRTLMHLRNDSGDLCCVNLLAA